MNPEARKKRNCRIKPARSTESPQELQERHRASGITLDEATIQLLRERLWGEALRGADASDFKDLVTVLVALRRQVAAEDQSQDRSDRPEDVQRAVRDLLGEPFAKTPEART